jgi:Fe-S-cluster containining protein
MPDAKPKFVFTCQRCGRCCERDVEVSLGDIERWSEKGVIYQVFPHLSIPSDSPAVSMYLEMEDGKCSMYDSESKSCRIYDDRPQSCMAYPLEFDGSGFLLRDKDCPGIGQGEMNREALEEIRQAARDEHDGEMRTAFVLPMLQGIFLKEIAKRSEEAIGKLSDEERAKLEEILKTEQK